jgi:hypothetical protein
MSFQTELAAPTAVTAPSNVGPQQGGTGAGGYDAPLNPTFQWSPISNATNYEFQLSTDPNFGSFLINLSGITALGNVNAYQLAGVTLDYGKTYYWRVRATSANSNTDWSPAYAFSTMAKPTTAPPPVTVTQQSAPTITIPPATSTQIVITQAPTKEVSPTYIWAIIIVGAVLVIAVIVLIVRTRRSV